MLVGEKTFAKRGGQSVNIHGLKCQHEIEIVGRSWDAPVVAGHRADEHVGNAQAVETLQTIDQRFPFGSHRRAASILC